MRRLCYWLVSNAANNISQIPVALASCLALVYGVNEYESSKIRHKIDIANNSIDRMTDSIDEHTATYLRLIKSNSGNAEIIRKIIQSKPFRCDCSILNLTDKNGNISAENSNKIRFGIVKYLNSWEGMSIVYMKNLGDCDILYQNRIGSLYKEWGYVNSIINFIEIFEEENNSYGVSWNNFISLSNDIKSYCSGNSTKIDCVQKVNRKECNIGTM